MKTWLPERCRGHTCWGQASRFQTVSGWEKKNDLQVLSQCGSTFNCLSRSVPEIHKPFAGTSSNNQPPQTIQGIWKQDCLRGGVAMPAEDKLHSPRSLRWPRGIASSSCAEDLGIAPRYHHRPSHSSDLVVLRWLSFQTPGSIGSALGLVSPVSVYCGWVRENVWCVSSVSVWQHAKLSLRYISLLLAR